MRRFSFVAAFGVVAIGLSSVGDADAARAATAVPPAEYRPSTVTPKSEASTLVASDVALRISLPAPTATETAVLAARNAKAKAISGKRAPRSKAMPLAVGFPRAVPASARDVALSSLAWQTLDDSSRVTRVEVHSPGAAAIRLALTLSRAHPDLAIKFAGNGVRAAVFGPQPANAIAESIERSGTFWTPVLEGDTATIELHAPAGASFDGVTMRLGSLAHMVAAGESLQRMDTKRASEIGLAGDCNIDIACVQPSVALTQAANSIGKVVFNDRAGFVYWCSGTMLNDSTRTFTPYVLSASHCMAEDPAFMASTVNMYWFFRAQTCDSLAVPPYALQAGGSMLLARSDDWDWMLLRLNTLPPAGVTFSAWRAEPVPEGSVVTGLHHPRGDLGKFSQGFTSCAGETQCQAGYRIYPDGTTFIRVRWSQGTTEVGSSGSGLFTFLQGGGFYELRGALFGGDASCAATGGSDNYSRLDNMLPLTRQYLTPDAPNPTGLAVVVEFYNESLDHYFITTDANEINLLDTGVLRGWVRTGLRFLAYSTPAPGTNPVCRFYLRPEVGDSHFYSGDPNECAQTLARFGASWIYESPSVFHIALPNMVTGECPAGTTQVWRFFNSQTTNHRYTTEVLTREILRADPRWVSEGYGPDAVIMCAVNG